MLFPKWGSTTPQNKCPTNAVPQMGLHGDPQHSSDTMQQIMQTQQNQKHIKIKIITGGVPHKHAPLSPASFELCLLGKQISRHRYYNKTEMKEAKFKVKAMQNRSQRRPQNRSQRRPQRLAHTSEALRQLIFITSLWLRLLAQGNALGSFIGPRAGPYISHLSGVPK